ncbi:MAG TPA: hypothetical protein VN408_40615 [Actinoplanes sp.]|nr:hypothetical protein [Actinoplanes sp.]
MTARTLGAVAAWLVTVLLDVVAALGALFLWAAWLTGDYRTDRDMLENSGVWLTLTALIAGGSAAVALLIGLGAVRLRWLPRWAPAVPAALLAATLIAYAATRIA